METFIDRLIQHQTITPQRDMDVVFDIGALNGGYGAGVALYLRRMEMQKRVMVYRVSGCSIGAFLAAWYCSGCDEALFQHAEDMFLAYKREASLAAYETMMPAFVTAAFSSDDAVKALRGRLFINYYDTKKHRQITVTKFKSRQHLCECILRSSHIPYVLNGQARRDKRYMDGMVPYIFSDNVRPCLFVDMLSLRKLWRVFITRAEVTIYQRMFVGVMDAHQFFVTQRHSDMCSWQAAWPWWYRVMLKSRLFGCLSVLYFCEWLLVIWKHVRVQHDVQLFTAFIAVIQRHLIQN